MEQNLLPEIVLVLVCAAGLGLLLHHRLQTRRAAMTVAVAALAWLAVTTFYLRGTTTFARWLPWRDVMVLADLQPFAVALLVAALLRISNGRRVLRIGLATILACICLWDSYGPLFQSQPNTRNRWSGAVCRQTSRASCSAAAAATLLKLHGIDATETEMTQLCFTSTAGTRPLGLYRGLVIKTEGTPWRAVAFHGDLDVLRAAGRPAIMARVGLSRWQTADARYSREWGWSPGEMHTVVFLGTAADGKVDIGDPSIGKEQWFEQGIRDLWRGEGFWLVKR